MLIHGHCKHRTIGTTPEYRAYWAMRNRCLNPNQVRFKDYGARGITICDRWLFGDGEKTGFECFLADMGPKPSSQHTLDRRDNNLGYEKQNCRWATRIEQARNTRATRFVNIYGIEVSVAEAIEYCSTVPAGTVRRRMARGWPDHDAILVPKGGKLGDADAPVVF